MNGYTFPVVGGRITSEFGPRKAPTKGATTIHQGVDIAVPTGTSVLSALSGVVKKAGYNSSSGNYITVDHGGGLETTYKHLSRIIAPSSGTKVSEGDVIGLSGNTGVSTGPHLHFEMIKDGRYVNPMEFNVSSLNIPGVGDVMDHINTDGIVEFLKANWWLIAGGLVVIAIIK